MSNHKDNNGQLADVSTNPNSNEEKDLKIQNTAALVKQFDDIGSQAQLYQGRILLELYARSYSERISFEEFAKKEGIEGSTLCALTHQHRTRLMNLAKFFVEPRKIEGISVTVGYEISAPKNEKVAEKVYNLAVGQCYSVKEIRAIIDKEKLGLNKNKTQSPDAKVEYSKKVTMTREATEVMNFVRSLKPDNFDLKEALVIFKTCYAKIKEDIEGNVIDGTVAA